MLLGDMLCADIEASLSSRAIGHRPIEHEEGVAGAIIEDLIGQSQRAGSPHGLLFLQAACYCQTCQHAVHALQVISCD